MHDFLIVAMTPDGERTEEHAAVYFEALAKARRLILEASMPGGHVSPIKGYFLGFWIVSEADLTPVASVRITACREPAPTAEEVAAVTPDSEQRAAQPALVA